MKDWIPYSDAWNADRFVQEHGENVLWVSEWNHWLHFNGKRWTRSAGEKIGAMMETTIRGLVDESRSMDGDAASNLLKHIGASLKQNRIKAATEICKWRCLASPNDFNTDPFLLNCQNGTIDLRTGNLQPHERNDFITHISPMKYDPIADMAFFQSILDTFLPDPDVQGFVKRAAGYSATGLATEECMFFPFGPTGTGKSTILRAMQGAMGDYGATADFAILLAQVNDAHGDRPKTELARLAGKRLVVSSEVEEGAKMAESVLKWITGQDIVVARKLYGHEFEFLPSFTLWLAANDRPHINPKAEAVWRRIHQIGFNEQIPTDAQDRSIKSDVAKNAGVLRWIVEGAIEWQKDGLAPPAKVKAMLDAYRAEVDEVASFIKTMCVTDAEARVDLGTLFDEYKQWGGRKGKRQFSKDLTSKGFEQRKIKVNGKTVWGWVNLGLSTFTDDF